MTGLSYPRTIYSFTSFDEAGEAQPHLARSAPPLPSSPPKQDHGASSHNPVGQNPIQQKVARCKKKTRRTIPDLLPQIEPPHTQYTISTNSPLCVFPGPSSSTYLLRLSHAHPSIPSPRLPGWTPGTLMPAIPGVSSSQLCPAIPPALARFSGTSSSIGWRKSAMRFASSSLKWYFSRSTSGKDQCRNLWMLRSSPFRLKISCDHLPDRHMDFGKGPKSSMIWAIWSSSLPYFVPD